MPNWRTARTGALLAVLLAWATTFALADEPLQGEFIAATRAPAGGDVDYTLFASTGISVTLTDQGEAAAPVVWEAADCDCCSEPVAPLRLRGGLSYFSVPGVETKTGGTYGLDGIHMLDCRTGAYGAGKVNHISNGTQFLASGGLFRMSDPCGCSPIDRIGFAAIVDYFEDTRQDDLDFSQLRVQAGLPVCCNWAVGVAYTKPLDDDIQPLLFLGNGSVLEPTELIAGFAAGYVGNNLVYLAAGHRESSDTTYFDATVRKPRGGNCFTFVDVHYEERGRWVGVVGVEYRFGAGCKGGCGCCSCCWQPNPCSPWDDPAIAEAFNSGEGKTWGRDIDNEDGMTQIDPPQIEL